MHIIIKPLITEKTSNVNSKGLYSFVVAKKANKPEIKKAIENIYKVDVINVNTMICPSKSITKYTKKKVLRGSKQSYKKAVVSLKKGQSIDLYGNV